MNLSNAEAAIVVCVIANGVPPHAADPRDVAVLVAGGALAPASIPGDYSATPAGRNMLGRHLPEREGCMVGLWPGPRLVATKRIARDSPDEYCVAVAASLPLLDMKLKGSL